VFFCIFYLVIRLKINPEQLFKLTIIDMTKQEHVELSFSSDKKGRSGLWLKVDQYIPFEWEKIRDYYFLNLSLKKKLPEKIKELRKKYPHAYEPWTKELDDQLEVEFCEGRSTKGTL
jgi:hypothetical protein